MEYMTAHPGMEDAIYNVLHTTIETIYPKYYPKEVVQFFYKSVCPASLSEPGLWNADNELFRSGNYKKISGSCSGGFTSGGILI